MKPLLLAGLAFTLICGSPARAAPPAMPAGAGHFDFSRAGKTVRVWYARPASAGADSPIVFVMHGVKRNGEDYRNGWQPHARQHGFVLVVPEFSEAEFPGDAGYNFGNTVDAQGKLRPPHEWAFNFVEPIFDEVRAACGSTRPRYFLYGHSAGAQFVHRFVYFVPEARAESLIAANAGWYTLPDLMLDFPYGLRGSPVSEPALRRALERPLVVLLGTADTDPNHPHLRRTPEAMAQGPHRFARGEFFHAAGRRQAEALGTTFGWQLAPAPGVAHSNAGMARHAVERLFGQPRR